MGCCTTSWPTGIARTRQPGKFAEREAAGRALSAIGTPALSALRKAASTSEDPEERLRAGRLVAEVMRRSRPAALDCTGEKGVSPADVRRAQQAWAKHLGRNVEETIEIAGGVKMTFVLIPPGKFPMGFPENEKYREVDETLHEVMLTEPFDLAKTEVTQAQYQALGLDNPSHFKGDHFPVEQVSWKEAQHWAEQLPKKQADKHLFRLPTEAEWEYACRGGRPSSLCYGIGDGRVLSSREANIDGNHPYAGAAKGKYLAGTCAVASHPAKAFGLYDVVGNVWEWCADWYGRYPDGSETDPTGPSEGSQRVVRGGGWSGGVGGVGGCRASYRRGYNPSFRDNDLGFRLARSVASDVQ
jgi:sulfatase modifying factor 1